MAVAEIIPIANFQPREVDLKKPKYPPGMAFVPYVLDDLGLSIEAFRVFSHFCRAAQLMDDEWIVWEESLEYIGNICFAASYPNAQAPYLRIKVAKAIEELEARNLILVTRSNRGNTYQIMPSGGWKSPDEGWQNPNQRTRDRKVPTVAKVKPAVAKAEPIVVEVSETTTPVASIAEISEVATSEDVMEFEFSFEEGVCHEGENPEPTTEAEFNPESYDWVNFHYGDSQVPISFWDYSHSKVLELQAKRAMTNHEQQIDDTIAYTEGALRKQGLERFLYWQQHQNSQIIPAAVDPDGIPRGTETTIDDIGLASSIAKDYWQELELSWRDPKVLDWMAWAESQYPGFKYDPDKASFYNLLPDVLIRLANDLETLIHKRLGGAV